ncbi:Na(+)/H(+) antiporter subunit C [Rosistilla carotiformis]|uniref:Na(+)/H(+) antiporter subunit C n=1 Tax=Rosistilla carotiformis TaxID=2528017 RepID=A0A518JUL9_9BACT|nr:Na+/H+ antiporter subunit C [Rosistilla carotiformis]QDV69248.1 Na(+)/H(+) antiporter subunit C [Rosistilla carotiformis]
MDIVLAITVGGLYAAGIYMMLRRSVVKLLIGLGLLSHAANLLIFTAGGVVRGRAPVVPSGEMQPLAEVADQLPQALILTAIVISFAVLAFALVLVYRTYQTLETDDLDQLKATDK